MKIIVLTCETLLKQETFDNYTYTPGEQVKDTASAFTTGPISSISTITTTASVPQLPSCSTPKPKLGLYWTIVICVLCLLASTAMVAAVLLYKIRTNYYLQRQINQFVRIDAQLEQLRDQNPIY
jgi:hypothetical protein